MIAKGLNFTWNSSKNPEFNFGGPDRFHSQILAVAALKAPQPKFFLAVATLEAPQPNFILAVAAL